MSDRKTVSISFNKKELWELINNFGQSFEAGAKGNELSDKIMEKLSDAHMKFNNEKKK